MRLLLILEFRGTESLGDARVSDVSSRLPLGLLICWNAWASFCALGSTRIVQARLNWASWCGSTAGTTCELRMAAARGRAELRAC